MNDPDLLREQVRAWIDAHFDPGMTLREGERRFLPGLKTRVSTPQN